MRHNELLFENIPVALYNFCYKDLEERKRNRKLFKSVSAASGYLGIGNEELIKGIACKSQIERKISNDIFAARLISKKEYDLITLKK